MKCPCGNAERIRGHLNCGTVLGRNKKHKLSPAADDAEQYALKLEKTAVSLLHAGHDLCPECKRIMIDSSNYKNNLYP